ncbi:hypothetical protein FBUS_02321 [Fasciolopsis buskii]|uniref:EGF-like domain-containing protein n=1 Tax=Fasciolopsis buskii TaxID=27845 RepID=A0A8E0RZF5_9TREM|nr:hypothetical protein FBUS_02321 [Fasciolopsis buski]
MLFYQTFAVWLHLWIAFNFVQYDESLQLFKARCLTGFSCDRDRCLDRSALCDGNFDCIDRSDESHCAPCNWNEIRCIGGKCIPRTDLCNDHVDCPSGEDERPSFCLAHKCPNAFLCQIALDTCIAKPCSGQPQCADYSDQDPDVCSAISRMRQNVTCQVNEFACHSGGQCIHQFYRCDGVQDCADGSDETAAAGCSHFVGTSTSKANFVCSDGHSIPRDWICDQKADCPDGEDEAVGPHTRSQCSAESADAPNELHNCPSGMFACGRTSTLSARRCIPADRVCDGVYDCEDWSDELASCDDPCANRNQFTCHMGQRYRGEPKCVPLDAVCNGHADCPAGDDESDGPRTNCTIIRTCDRHNGGCSQLCSVVNGQVKCDCAPGYLSLPEAPRSCIARGDKAILYTTRGRLYQRFLGKNITRVLQFEIGSSVSNASVLIPTVQWKLTTDITGSESGIVNHHHDSLWRSLSDFDYTFDRAALTGLSEPLSLVLAHGTGLFDTSAMRLTNSPNMSRNSVRRKRHQIQYLHPLAVHPDVIPSDEYDQSQSEIDPIALAYDWVHDLIFWTNGTSRTVHATHRASGWSKLLLKMSEGNQPLGIVVDPRFAKIYWITRGRQSMIESMDMDGQNRKSLITDQLHSPYSLALDYVRNEIYWVDGTRGSVDAYQLSRQTRRTVIQSTDYYPVWVAVFEDWVYWSDQKQNALFRANKLNGADVELMFHVANPFSFRLQHDLLRPVWINRCARHSCTHLCLPVPLRSYPNYSEPFRCTCPDGWETDPRDSTHCRQINWNNESRMGNWTGLLSPVDPDTFWEQRASLLLDWLGNNRARSAASTVSAGMLNSVSGSVIPVVVLITLLAACLLALAASYVAIRNYRHHLKHQLNTRPTSQGSSSEAKLLLTSGPFTHSVTDESRPWANSSEQNSVDQESSERTRVQFHIDSSSALLNPKADGDC